MATLKTVNRGGANADVRKIAPPNPATFAAHSFTSAAVNNDLTGGCAASSAITGATRTRNASEDIVVAGWSSAAGTLTIETSSDGGTTWPNSDSDTVPAGEYVVSRTTPVGGANRYRVKFTCGATAASRVVFSSQSRT